MSEKDAVLFAIYLICWVVISDSAHQIAMLFMGRRKKAVEVTR